MLDLATDINNAMAARLEGLTTATQAPWTMAGTDARNVFSTYDSVTPSYAWNVNALTRVAPAVDLTEMNPANDAGVVDGGSLISRQFAAMAVHVGMTAGRKFQYVAPDGTTTIATVAANGWRQIAGTDRLIIKFTAPLPSTFSPKKRLPTNWGRYFQLTYFPAWLGGGQMSLPFFATRVSCCYINAEKKLGVGLWDGVQNLEKVEIGPDPANPTFATDTTIAGTSGNELFLIMPDGTNITLAEFYGSNGQPSDADLAPQINEAIDSMGGTSADHVQVYDLSAYQTYAAPSVPPAYVPPPDNTVYYGGPHVTTLIPVNSTATFTTIQAAINDAVVQATAGAIWFVCQGPVGDLSFDPTTTQLFVANELHFLGDVAWTPGLKASNDSAVANISTFVLVQGGGAGGTDNTAIYVQNMQIGNSTATGTTNVTVADTGSALPVKSVVFQNCRWVNGASLGSGATLKQQVLLTNAGNGGGVASAAFNSCILAPGTTTTATKLTVIAATAKGCQFNVALNQCDIDGTNVKGTNVAIVTLTATPPSSLVHVNGSMNFMFSNSAIVGQSATQSTFSAATSSYNGTVSTMAITGAGLITSDSQTNGTSLTTGKLAGSVWANRTASDYTLYANSPAIGLYTISPYCPTDMVGLPWPRMVNGVSIVDGGAGQFVVGAITGLASAVSGSDRAWTWDADPTADHYRASFDGGTTWTANLATPTTSKTGGAKQGQSILVESIDTLGAVLKIKSAAWSPPAGMMMVMA